MFSCTICSFQDLSGEKLRNHMRREHDERAFYCEKCEVTCKGRMKFKMHMASHRKISCKHCGQMIPYNSKSNHMRKCIGEKAFKCENCCALFNIKDNLKVHVTKQSCPIKCNLCDKQLKSAGFMNKHIASVHRVQTEVVKTTEGHIGLFQTTQFRKDLHCTLCDFIATKASKLKRHMIKHNPKPAKVEEKCPKCDLTFKYKSEFNRHIQTPHCDRMKGNSRSSHYRHLKKIKVAQAKHNGTEIAQTVMLLPC